jgi:hypothetical protein
MWSLTEVKLNSDRSLTGLLRRSKSQLDTVGQDADTKHQWKWLLPLFFSIQKGLRLISVELSFSTQRLG